MTDQSQVNKKKTRIKLVGVAWTYQGFQQYQIIECERVISGKDIFIADNGARIQSFNHLYEIEILPDEPAPMPEPEKPFEFRQNDRVKCVFFGDEIFALGESEDGFVWFLRQSIEYKFHLDGKDESLHTVPVLTLVERPKKTVKKKYWVASYMRKNNSVCPEVLTVTSHPHESLDDLKCTFRSRDDSQFHEITREENE